MMRACGLILGGASLATLAGFTIALSSGGTVPATVAAHVGGVARSAAIAAMSRRYRGVPASRMAATGRARTLAFVGTHFVIRSAAAATSLRTCL